MVRFGDFVSAHVGHNWAIVKRRTANLRHRYDALLLPREYAALETEYERAYGMHPTSEAYYAALRA